MTIRISNTWYIMTSGVRLPCAQLMEDVSTSDCWDSSFIHSLIPLTFIFLSPILISVTLLPSPISLQGWCLYFITLSCLALLKNTHFFFFGWAFCFFLSGIRLLILFCFSPLFPTDYWALEVCSCWCVYTFKLLASGCWREFYLAYNAVQCPLEVNC